MTEPAGKVQLYATAPAIGATLNPLAVEEIAPRFPTACVAEKVQPVLFPILVEPYAV